MKDKIVCFAGHRFEWHNIGIEEKLKKVIIYLINEGYNTFYEANNGYFDQLASAILINLKTEYPHIKIFRILSYYNSSQKKLTIPSAYNGSILPALSNIHYKQKIIKMNQWIVDHSNVLICHIIHTNNSGAFLTVKYARSKRIKIISI